MSEEDGETKLPVTEKSKSGLWVRLKKRLQRRGVVEIDIDHHRYKMLNCIRVGIQNIANNHPELGPKDDLTQEDFTHVLTQSFLTKKGRKFTFRSYASSVFASIRRAVSLSEEEYFTKLAPPSLPYLEFISNSRSGQDFYLSPDQQYILKTDRGYNIKFFISFLGEYLEHFQMYPHSLIVKFLGLYSIEMPDTKKIYFLSMQNIFYPPQRIEIRFDVKGCLGNRFQKPNSPGSQVLTILKDQNFLDEKLFLGSHCSWFEKQLKIDVEFFRDLGVQDYSLLIGRHKLHPEETHESLQEMVKRVRLSLPHKKSSDSQRRWSMKKVQPSTWHIEPTPVVEDNNAETNSLPGEVQETYVTHEPRLKQTYGKKKVSAFRNLVEDQNLGLETFEVTNRRLLPNCSNPLHVLDGKDYRYYMGIIDFFTQYECRQRSARLLKCFKLCTMDHSTVPPDLYADRFVRFITERTE